MQNDKIKQIVKKHYGKIAAGGALLKDDYLKIIKDAGFEVNVLSEDKGISKRQYEGAPLESLEVEVVK